MHSSGFIHTAFLGGAMSGGEILLIMLALLLLFGSKNLPSIARNIGKSMETFRRASREVTDEIMRADITADRAPPPPERPVSTTPEIDTRAAPDAEVPPVVKPNEHSVGRHETPSSS